MQFVMSLIFYTMLFVLCAALLLHIRLKASVSLGQRDVIQALALLLIFSAVVMRIVEGPPVSWSNVAAAWGLATYFATDPRVRNDLPSWMNYSELRLNAWIVGKIRKARESLHRNR